MMRSLFSGVSGLRTHQSKMDVIGNNIANVNTVGFKSSAVTFQDIMYQTTSGASGATQTMGGRNALQTGLGVNTGSTKISIESGGAAQSTGNAFDLRFTDQSSTNFFIVNNGSQNLFTRAGSFYIDGAGNLAMTSTGYMVQGWQFDEETNSIRRDTVSPLRIMSPENRVSTPQWTTDMTVAGVLDKNDTDVTNEKGYINSLTVYDNLGYEYTVRFSTRFFSDTQEVDAQGNPGKLGSELKYTTKLDSIKDSQGRDILADYVERRLEEEGNNPTGGVPAGTRAKTRMEIEAEIFGSAEGTEKVMYPVSNKTKYPIEGGRVSYYNSKDDKTYYVPDNFGTGNLGTDDGNPRRQDTGKVDKQGNPIYTYFVKLYTDPKNPTDPAYEIGLSQLFGMSDKKFEEYINDTEKNAKFSINGAGQLTVEYNATNYLMDYDVTYGTLNSIGGTETNVPLNLQLLMDSFTGINIDYTESLAYDNGGTSTMSMDRGQREDISVGTGRKLGALTGLSVSQNGEIWGSYDNGTNKCLGMIPVARFANAMGLESLGNNCYAQTLNSGDFDGIGVDVTADGGSINSGQLEMSNVDLSSEFTEMITTQRGFQANSRIITVSDTMLEELTNLKR